jgi:HK97 family phage prohead protease
MAKKIQTYIFKKSDWTTEEARKWLDDHDARSDKVDETDESYRFRQFPPDQCADNSFETLTENFPAGLSAVACNVSRALVQVSEEVDTFSEIEPRLMAMLMKRAEPRENERLIVLKGCNALIEKDAAENGRLRFRITTDSEDRMGDVIDPGGWFFGNYERNPIVLFNHEYGEVAGSPPSQGKTLLIEKYDHGLNAVVEFHRKTRFNEELYALYKDGFMSTTSVGFWPMDRPEERETKAGGRGLKFTKQDLLEWSLVAVPANPDAFAMAMKKGLVRPRTAEYLSSLLAPYADRQGDGAQGENRHKAAQEQERLDEAGRGLTAALANLTFTNRRLGK